MYYIAKNELQMRQYIKDVIWGDKDEKIEIRKEVLKTEFGNIGKAGEYICSYLEKEILYEGY